MNYPATLSELREMFATSERPPEIGGKRMGRRTVRKRKKEDYTALTKWMLLYSLLFRMANDRIRSDNNLLYLISYDVFMH
jgi:hypothetical protein